MGEACNKLGKNRQGSEAIVFFRRGCELENTNSCISLAENIRSENRQEALRVLKYSCDRGNTRACVLFAEMSLDKAQ